MKKVFVLFMIAVFAFVSKTTAQVFTVADFENDAIGKTYEVYTTYYTTDGTAKVAANPTLSAQKSLHVETTNYGVRAKLNVTLPAGKTLADYSDLKFDTYWTLTGDARYKSMVIYINDTKFVETDYVLQGETSVWTAHSYSLSGLTALAGLNTFELQIGISLEGDYFLDNIVLTDGSGGGEGGGGEDSYYIIDFDATLPTAHGIVNNAGTAVTSGSTVIANGPGRTDQALHATFGGYEQNLQMSITLPSGKTLSNYESIELEINYPTTGDNKYKDVKYSINNGTKTNIDATGDKLGTWKTLTIPLSVSGGNTFTFEIGYNAGSGANFYIDNFKMKEKSESNGGGETGESSVFEDFESKNTGDVYEMKRWYPEDASATVAADPANAAEKSVHIVTSNWDAYLKMNIVLPEEKTLADYETFAFDIYIGANPNDEYAIYKKLYIYLDDEKKYRDYEEDEYPEQAPLATWTTKTYSLADWALSAAENAKTAFSLAFGISTDKGDYYIDNVRLTEKAGMGIDLVSKESQAIDWSKAANIQVFDLNGRLLKQAVSNGNLSGLPAGSYILKGELNGKPVVGKIMKTNFR
jgi:hypothetical protein